MWRCHSRPLESTRGRAPEPAPAMVHAARICAGCGSTRGVSLATLAKLVGVDPSHLPGSRRGRASRASTFSSGGAVALGADLGIRLSGGTGPRIHDRFQAPMLGAFITGAASAMGGEAEVPAGRDAGSSTRSGRPLTPAVVASVAVRDSAVRATGSLGSRQGGSARRPVRGASGLAAVAPPIDRGHACACPHLRGVVPGCLSS
jgi:hypothetical protein